MSMGYGVDRRTLLTALVGAVTMPFATPARAITAAIQREHALQTTSESSCMPNDDTLRNVGVKFTADGAPMRFAGNTIICHIPMHTPVSRALIGVRDELAQPPWRSAFSFLPPESYHMTFFDGASPRIQEGGTWFEGLALDLDMDAVNLYVERRLRSMRLALEAPIRMRLDHFQLSDTIKVVWAPATAEENVRLRAAREFLSERLRLRRPNHESYRFHTTLAYKVRDLSQRDLRTLQDRLDQMPMTRHPELEDIQLGRPEYCTYWDMLSYNTQFFL